jgi:hypothetical protein
MHEQNVHGRRGPPCMGLYRRMEGPILIGIARYTSPNMNWTCKLDVNGSCMAIGMIFIKCTISLKPSKMPCPKSKCKLMSNGWKAYCIRNKCHVGQNFIWALEISEI